MKVSCARASQITLPQVNTTRNPPTPATTKTIDTLINAAIFAGTFIYENGDEWYHHHYSTQIRSRLHHPDF